MLAVPGWGRLQRAFEARAMARLEDRELPPFPRMAAPSGLRAFARIARTLLRTLLSRAPASSCEFLVFTLAGRAGDARDAYFGPLSEALGAERSTTVFLAAGREARSASNARRTPLEAYARVPDIFAAWSEARAARLHGAPTDRDHAALAQDLARLERDSGEAFMHAFMARAFRRMVLAVRPRVILFPFENRAWEKALILAAREAGVRKVVGYQHSSITPRHLAFEIPPGSVQPLPDQVLTVGDVTARWLRERAPVLADRIGVGASLRRVTASIPLPEGHGLLVAISSSADEALALMAMVHAAAPQIGMPVVFRSHPTIPAEGLFARFTWPGHVRLSRGTTLEEDLAAATIVGYASSTVALDGMLQGRLPLFLDVGDIPEADPLIGDCPGKLRAHDAGSLARILLETCAWEGARLEAQRAEARTYAERYLQEPTEARIRSVVERVTTPRNTTGKELRITAVIPTKNRPEELAVAVASLLAQARRPDELLVIDQSATDQGRRNVEALLASDRATGAAPICLDYILDPSIRGLVHAKQVAAGRAGGDVVCFLEDDEVLEAGYLAAIESGFRDHPDMLGCCGLVTNLPPLPPAYTAAFHLFHRGMFRDVRVGVHGARGDLPGRIPSRFLSGGLSCWRREVLAEVPFDVENGFHMLEDIDYSSRVADRFGERLYINTRARLEHRMSPVNRDVLGLRQRRKLREFLVFYKKRRHLPFAGLQLGWLLCGLLLEALWQALATRKPGVLPGFLQGIADGVRWRLRA